jgi:hypothetical protein
VRGCFVAATRQIKVSDGLIVKATKSVHSFWRQIDSTLNGSGSGEEEFLLTNESLMSFIKSEVEFSHLLSLALTFED